MKREERKEGETREADDVRMACASESDVGLLVAFERSGDRLVI